MKTSEIIMRHYEKISDCMVDRFESMLKSSGKIQYGIYIWEDGTIQIHEQSQGDNSWLESRNGENLYYITTIGVPCLDLWEMTGTVPPEDEDEIDQLEQDMIEWLVAEYRSTVSDKLDAIIENFKNIELLGNEQ